MFHLLQASPLPQRAGKAISLTTSKALEIAMAPPPAIRRGIHWEPNAMRLLAERRWIESHRFEKPARSLALGSKLDSKASFPYFNLFSPRLCEDVQTASISLRRTKRR